MEYGDDIFEQLFFEQDIDLNDTVDLEIALPADYNMVLEDLATALSIDSFELARDMIMQVLDVNCTEIQDTIKEHKTKYNLN